MQSADSEITGWGRVCCLEVHHGVATKAAALPGGPHLVSLVAFALDKCPHGERAPFLTMVSYQLIHTGSRGLETSDKLKFKC